MENSDGKRIEPSLAFSEKNTRGVFVQEYIKKAKDLKDAFLIDRLASNPKMLLKHWMEVRTYVKEVKLSLEMGKMDYYTRSLCRFLKRETNVCSKKDITE